MAWTDKIKDSRGANENLIKQYEENRRLTFKRLTPMVIKLLEELGEAVWCPCVGDSRIPIKS
jgi:hypothetical protein